jgi:diadenosine tetraphosphatase ApaH/serine/threonine PP2A family protein phosphatase
MYAAAAPRADGLLLLCGGRGADSAPLSDAFGLARHRDGRWEWAAAPGEAPTARYQHAVSFVGTRLHVSGGALGGGSMVDDSLSLAVLNTSAGPTAGWSVTEVRARESPSAGGAKDAAAAASRRCRHTTAGVGPLVFTCGGLRGGTLLGDMYVSEEPPSEAGMTRAEATLALAEVIDLAAPAWQRWLRDVGLLEEAARATATLPLKTEAEEDDVGETFGGTLPRTGTTTSSKTGTSGVRSGSGAFGTPQGGSFAVNTPGSKDGSPENNLDSLAKLSSAEARAAVALAHRTNVDIDSSPESAGSGKRYVTPSPGSSAGKKHTPSSVRPPPSSDVRLHHRAVVVAAGLDGTGPTGLGSLVRQLSIDQFESESKRIGAPGELATPARMGGGDPGLMTPNTGARGGYTPEDPEAADSVHKRVINKLLLPRSWEPPADRSFILNADEIDELCLAAEEKFKQEPTVLKLRAPTKIFGDLHGQFGDLMRLFAEYGSPSTVGDIAYIDYLFLGDYVDRGAFSLETMSLLLALKVEYPDSVHLLRGNHEEADINALFGFRIECIDRLGEAAGVKAWNRFNDMFQWLPLAAVIEDRVACMHGGIGRSVTHISQLEELERPLTMESGGMMLMDVLWSDPTESDKVEGLRPNARGPGLVTFGPDRVRKFCEDNDLQMIIRAHECVMDGFERFAGGLLITVFSATNYCGTANNAGAILVLGRDLTLYPKLIHPLPPSALYGSAGSIDEDMDGPWQMGLNKERPPTPPRGRGDGRGRPTGAVA